MTYNRNEPIMPFVFYDLGKKGAKFRCFLHVAEGFERLGESLIIPSDENLPVIVQTLQNAGFFPEINSVGLMKKSNTFVVRFNLTFAYDINSAFDTMRAVGFKLYTLITKGVIPNPYTGLIEIDPERIAASQTLSKMIPDDYEPEDTDDGEDDNVEDSVWSDFINTLEVPDDDDDDDDSSGGTFPVPAF